MFRILAVLLPLQWGSRYARLDKSPSQWEFDFMTKLIRLRYALSRKKNHRASSGQEESISHRRLRQRFLAFSVPPIRAEESAHAQLPSIRLLWVAHPKDFDVLPHSVLAALRHVKNPVTAIDVVSPAPEEAARLLSPQIPSTTTVNYVHDNDVVSKEIREKLIHEMSSHGAWATQQLIKVLMAISQPEEATLVIDADTVLLRDKVWVNARAQQLLYFRGYTNPRYQHYLRSWGVGEIDDLRSFVTHHMLYQPEILRGVLSSTFGSSTPDALAGAIIASAQELGFPEFSADYELYGNVLWAQHPANYFLDKYSNIGQTRPGNPASLDAALVKLRQQGRYNSASFHLPNR